MKNLVIAVDGPAGAGKSTSSKNVGNKSSASIKDRKKGITRNEKTIRWRMNKWKWIS